MKEKYNYFSECFHYVYDWIDQSLWADKKFVLEVLEIDQDAVLKVSESLVDDEEFRAYVEENVDLEFMISSNPKGEYPQWIKDWKS